MSPKVILLDIDKKNNNSYQQNTSCSKIIFLFQKICLKIRRGNKT